MAAPPDPTFRIPLSRGLLPRTALERVHGLGRSVFLEGGGGGGRSLVSAAPRRIVRVALGAASGASFLEEELFSFAPRAPETPTSSQEPSERRFAGGWIGYLGYEFADFLEQLPAPASDGMGMPILWFGWYDWAAVWDRGGGVGLLEGAPAPGADPAEFEARLLRVRDLLEGNTEELERWEWEGGNAAPSARSGPMGRDGEAPRLPEGVPLPGHPGVRSSLGREGFVRGVDRIRDQIRVGEIYQANLTQQLWAPFPRGEGLPFFRALQRRSPAPFAAYLDTGEGEIASVSPEGFLSLKGRTVHTRPIKGTAPAGAARQLAASEKDRAENVMIVDLLRNDLSRVCRPDSVRVPRLLELERHPPVHHLVSTVTGELEEGFDGADLLCATFPGGSITGAPKLRAIEILREEEPVRREVYTGALGLIERNGDMELSIAIRTAVVRGGWASWGAGGGITLASDPSAEWWESLDKAGSFLQALSEWAGGERPGPNGPAGSTSLGGRTGGDG
ncbi:MAG: anthranilate synthase component I family protein [Gemmatimonadota bacterium]